MPHRLVIGCGYLGLRVARRWAAEEAAVYALTRSSQRAKQLEACGLRPIVADVTRPDTLANLPDAETVLYSLGYDPTAGASREEVYVDGLRNVLERLPDRVERILYTSSTGVYGEAGGQWVDEDSPCHPVREGGRILLAAEGLLRNHRLGDRAIVLRLAGLYGPDRALRMNDLLAGRPIAVPPGGCLNLIHVDDAVQAVLAAEAQARPPRTYLVADGHPTTRRDFYLYLAELLEKGDITDFRERSRTLPVPSPPKSVMSPLSAQRGGADKRVRNTRLLEELGIQLRYPSYREGLAAIVAGLK